VQIDGTLNKLSTVNTPISIAPLTNEIAKTLSRHGSRRTESSFELMMMKLREYVDDTEDYINIMLDDKQNQLLQMGIMLSTGTLVVSCAIAATGVFGMNITIPLYTAATEGVFWQVTGGIVGAAAAVYLVALLCYRRSGILQ